MRKQVSPSPRSGAFIKVKGIINSYKYHVTLVQNLQASANKQMMTRTFTALE